MCGIFGVVLGDRVAFDRVKKYTGFLMDATIASSVRGTASSGIFAVKRNGAAELLKRPIAPWDFLDQEKTRNMYSDINDYNVMVGHVRAPTRGASNYSNSHPFHHGNVIMVHNGTLDTIAPLGMAWSYGTDSEHIAKALDVAHNPIDVLEKIHGAFALAWYDKRTDCTYLARNDQRELHYIDIEKDGSVLIASECRMLEWIAERQGLEFRQTWQVAEFSMVTIPRNNPSKSTVTKFNGYTPPIVLAPNWATGYGRGRAHHTPHKSVLHYTLLADEIKKLGVEKGQEISFEGLDVFLPKAKSKSGILEGLMFNDPWFVVRAGGVDIRKIFNPNNFSLKGKIVGVLGATTQTPVVIVSDVVVDLNSKNKASIPVKTHIRDVGITDMSLFPESHNTTTGNTAEKDTIILLDVPGPGGKLISRAEYATLTKHGCGFCQSDLPVENAGRVLWIQDAPVCSACSLEESKGNRPN